MAGKLGLDDVAADVDLSALKSLKRETTAPVDKAAARTPLIDTHFKKAAQPDAPERVVKDTFTFPPADLVQLDELVTKALRSGKRLGKSAIVRAGIQLLASLDDQAFAAAISDIEEAKRGPRRR